MLLVFTSSKFIGPPLSYRVLCLHFFCVCGSRLTKFIFIASVPTGHKSQGRLTLSAKSADLNTRLHQLIVQPIPVSAIDWQISSAAQDLSCSDLLTFSASSVLPASFNVYAL